MSVELIAVEGLKGERVQYRTHPVYKTPAHEGLHPDWDAEWDPSAPNPHSGGPPGAYYYWNMTSKTRVTQVRERSACLTPHYVRSHVMIRSSNNDAGLTQWERPPHFEKNGSAGAAAKPQVIVKTEPGLKTGPAAAAAVGKKKKRSELSEDEDEEEDESGDAFSAKLASVHIRIPLWCGFRK